MAPTKRSKRKKKQKLRCSDPTLNTRGFPALPNELYLEILSYLPAFPVPHHVWQVDQKPDPYRQRALYSLSQTCRSLRNFFLRYAWEQIEVFRGMWTPQGRCDDTANGHKRLVDDTLHQIETVTVRNPNLRQYVTTVNLTILNNLCLSVVPWIARTLSILPNLHTLQLIFRLRLDYYEVLQGVFSKFRYPSVHTLNINKRREDLFIACPNLRNFSFYKDVGRWSSLSQLFGRECMRGIEKLGVMHLEGHLPDIVKFLPQLRDLSLEIHSLRYSAETLNCLSLLPLHTIRLRLDDWHSAHWRPFPATLDERQTWIDLAERILAKCPSQEVAKKVIVVNFDNTVEDRITSTYLRVSTAASPKESPC